MKRGNEMVDIVIRREGIDGGNRIFWANMSSYVGDFIKANGLKPARPTLEAGAVRRMEAKGAANIAQFPPIRIPGGIKVAHLHYANRIYLLDERQWAKFSGKIVADAKAKLAKVNEVSFDQAVMLGSVAQELAK